MDKAKLEEYLRYSSIPRFWPSSGRNKIELWPRISVITACYNAERYIERAILSVLNQNYANFEYIIIDGGSSDRTAEIIKKYAERIKWVSEPDRGQTNALNKGFALASGDVFGWLNADEEYLPDTLAKIGQAFKETKDLDIAFGDRIKIDKDRNYLCVQKLPAMHPRNFSIYTYGLLFSDTTFWSKQLHKRTGLLDEVNYPHLSMDFDWFIRLSVNVNKWKKIDQYLSLFIERDDRKTALASNLETSARRTRNQAIKELHISKTRLFIGWLFYAIQRRWQLSGPHGILWRPSMSRIRQIMGQID
jgi:glycosyltransferase involved in cell wall biosynthesis